MFWDPSTACFPFGPPKRGLFGGRGGGSQHLFFIRILIIFVRLGAHAKIRTPTTTPSMIFPFCPTKIGFFWEVGGVPEILSSSLES